jgi:arsenate reductase
MESSLGTEALAALGHPGRLAVFRLLARRAPQGVQPSEIAEALGMKRNTLSVHVHTLARAGLLRQWREGKAVYYALDLSRAAALVDFLVNDCCRGRPELCTPLAATALRRLDPGEPPMPDRPYSVLFICTGNSARSIFAEALLRHLGGDRFRAFSAGTRPYSELNPFALAVLRQAGHDVTELRAKTVAEFQGAEAPALDFVFTVCDRAANEECPPWPGQPITAHWGVPDPVAAEGTEAERALAFRRAYDALRRRIEYFVELPIDSLDRLSLQRRLDALGADAKAS